MGTSGTDEADLLTIPEAAEILKVSTVTISRWLKQERLPAHRVGPRAVRIRRGDLAKVMAPARGRPPIATRPTPAGREPASGLAAAERWSASTHSTGEPARTDLDGRLAMLTEARALRERILARRKGVTLPSAGAEVERARDKRGKRT